MSNLISFNGIEIRRIEDKLIGSCPLGRNNTFKSEIYIPNIRGVVFSMNETCTIGLSHVLTFYVKKNNTNLEKQINFHIPAYIVVTEKEVDVLLNGISKLMENK